ncbi:MAG TPA: SRPBCC family protein [Flavisolibacter sp.]|nr:SRPBCC family protein [Flavisolibacter sp.]
MPLIQLKTFIAAPQESVFDLSRSVDLHKYSMNHHREEVIGGVTEGLMKKGDTVTWKAKHLFKERMLKVKITKMHRPYFFMDEQIEGDFILMKHEHYFNSSDNGTIMIDQFRFESPFGILGKLVNHFYLEKYMANLLKERNEVIRKAAETSQWKQFIV